MSRRTVIVFPTKSGRGKWHASTLLDTAACDPRVALDVERHRIHITPDEDLARVHPIVCRRCLRERGER